MADGCHHASSTRYDMNTQIALARAAACLLLAAAGSPVHARQAAAAPQANVPATRYQSALDQRPGTVPAASPDANWVAGNATVAATNSMALTMKPMNAQAADPHAGHAQHDHAAMQGMGMRMDMDKKDSPAMCSPAAGAGPGAAGKGMQCMSGDKAGEGRMPCCPSCCQSCCKDKMKKDKEAP
jgi:hypothetical protein